MGSSENHEKQETLFNPDFHCIGIAVECESSVFRHTKVMKTRLSKIVDKGVVRATILLDILTCVHRIT